MSGPLFIGLNAWQGWFLQNQRVWLCGGPGTYKTILTLGIYDWLYNNDYVDRLYTNFACVWADTSIKIDKNRKLRALFGIDEIGLFAKRKLDIEHFLAYCRRYDGYTVFSGTDAPPVSARTFQISKWASLVRYGVGGSRIPYVIYMARVFSPPFNIQSDFFAFNPYEYFGLYASHGYNSTDNGLNAVVGYIARTIEQEYRGKYADKWSTNATYGIEIEAEGYEPYLWRPDGASSQSWLHVSDSVSNGGTNEEIAAALSDFGAVVGDIASGRLKRGKR